MAMTDPLEELNTIGCWDYQLHFFDGLNLSIIGGCDLTYANSHIVTAEFENVAYIQCATLFSHAVFRYSTDHEERMIAPFVPIGTEDRVIVIEAETMARLEPQRFYIVAQSVKVIRNSRSG